MALGKDDHDEGSKTDDVALSTKLFHPSSLTSTHSTRSTKYRRVAGGGSGSDGDVGTDSDVASDVDSSIDAAALNDPSLRRVAGKIPLHALLIVLNELCERFTFYGGSTVFYNYVFYPAPDAETRRLIADGHATLQPGALNRGHSTANALSYYFTFFSYLTPVIGAVIADQYWGKFRTIVTFSVIYLCGLIMLTGSSVPTSHTSDGTPVYGSFALPGYILAITIIGLGTGGIKSVVSPMCADQVESKSRAATIKGEKVIVDSEKTVQHLYNWFYWAINIGSLVGMLVCTTLERRNFWMAYLVPTCVFVVSIAIFVSGKNRYVHVPPQGSVILQSIRCSSYALKRKKKYANKIQIDKSAKFSFLEFAKPIPGETQDEIDARGWPVSFPDELRQTLKACSIFPLLSIYWVCYAQMTTNLTSQASQMRRPHWMSNDVVNVIDPLFLIILIPLFDSVIYPMLDHFKIRFTYMKRISLGFFLGASAMAYAAGIQAKIYNTGPGYKFPNPSEPNDVSIWLQIPAYMLIAASEIFASIGSMEYSYTHAPKTMKCFVSSLALLPTAVAALIGVFLAPASKNPNMTWMYTGTAIAAFLATIAFYWLFRQYDDDDDRIKASAAAEHAKGSENQVEYD